MSRSSPTTISRCTRDRNDDYTAAAASELLNPAKPDHPVRTVQFFRVYTATCAAGMTPFDSSALCRAIAYLGPQEYWEAGDGDVQVCAYLDNEDDLDRFALAKIRRRSRPLTEDAGVRGHLILQASTGLLDPIHVRLFPNNIMGVEFNYDGPRASRLRSFLREKLPDAYETFDMQPIYDRDALERLGRMDEIGLFHFQVDRSALDLRVKERNFFRGLLASAEQTDMSVIEIVARVANRSEHPDTAVVKDEIRELLTATAGVQKIKVRGREGNGKSEELDLLKDRLISRQYMMRLDATTRAIDPASAYHAIGEAYQAVRERIPEIAFLANE